MMPKKVFSPIMIRKISKPTISIDKHFDPYLEYPLSQNSCWYDTLDCPALTHEFGSPLFVASEKCIHTKIKQFLKIFQFNGFKTVIAYSFKTNYLPGICNIFLNEGCWAEVVSGMEYQLAEKLKVKGEHIIFNGPYKTSDELKKAIKGESTIHIDNWDELKKVQDIAADLKKKAKIGIRFSFSYFSFLWDKFGFYFDENEITTLLETIARDQYLDFVSIHNHCGTYIMEPDIYASSVNHIYRICQIAATFGLTPKIIDLGGGFPSNTRLKQQFSAGYISSGVDLSVYADAISDGLAKIRELLGKDLILVFEPGRSLVDEAVILICTVVGNKKGLKGAHITLIDAGVNILPTTQWYQREPKPIGACELNYIKQRLCGPLCMQIDVLNEETYLPIMKAGMQLIIPNVGAYNQTQSMQFIQCRPATILIKNNNQPFLIRRKETFDDIFIGDYFQK